MADSHATADRRSFPPGFLDDFSVRILAKGELLSTPAQPSNQVLVVHSGRLRVYLASDSRELSIAYLLPGDLFSTHAPTFLRAVERSEVRLIEAPRFARKLAAYPEAAAGMLRVVGGILDKTVRLAEDLAFCEVPARLARFLLRQAEQRGVAEAAGILLPLDLSTEDIACLLGTTRQTVSSLINQWQRAGLLQRHGRRALLIPSLGALSAALGQGV